jgi:hypothetical protein
MSWDPKRHFGINDFGVHVQEAARKTMRGEWTKPILGNVFLPVWWTEKEIRVFWEEGISQETVDVIVGALRARVEETICTPFTVKLYGSHESAMEQVRLATTSNGELDEKRLFELSLSEVWRNEKFGGRQHGDIYITSRSFLDDHVSWGAASFKYGTMMFCLHGQRQNSKSFLRKVALHEMNHLLGMYCHCDDYQNVEGLRYTPECNAHYICPSGDLCDKCKGFILHWWTGILCEYKELCSQL